MLHRSSLLLGVFANCCHQDLAVIFIINVMQADGSTDFIFLARVSMPGKDFYLMYIMKSALK